MSTLDETQEDYKMSPQNSNAPVSRVGGIASSLNRMHEIGKCGECFLIHQSGICGRCGRECADIRDLEHEVKCFRMRLGSRGKDRCRGLGAHLVRCTPACETSTREGSVENPTLAPPLVIRP